MSQILQPRAPRRKLPASHAFTLIELLTAVALLSLLVVVLGQMASLASSSWATAQGQLDRRQKARAIADFIAADLAAALLPLDPSSTASFLLNPGIGEGLNNPSAVFWLAPVATDQTFGDIAEVGYFVRWDAAANPANPRASLCRFLVNPDPNNPNYAVLQNPRDWVSRALVDAVAPADKNHDYRGLFAEDVVGLWIRCLSVNPDGSLKELAGAGGSFDSSQAYEYDDPMTGGTKEKHLPFAVEVSLVMLDSRSASRIGPEEMAAIKSLAASAPDAGGFVAQALQNESLRGISSGMHAFATTTYLVNSK